MLLRTNKILMIRPAQFGFNAETAISNTFQTKLNVDTVLLAQQEFDEAVKKIRSFGVTVDVYQDSVEPIKPDAVFPNNWVQLRADGTLALFPMLTVNRRIERNEAAINFIQSKYHVEKLDDWSDWETENKYLEGTGSLVFDHFNKTGYACISPRTDKSLAEKYIDSMNYRSVLFKAAAMGKSIYHTNVVMAIAKDYALVCLDAITSKNERDRVSKELGEGRILIEISLDQMSAYAGNMIELSSDKGESVLIMSRSANDSLTNDQRKVLDRHSRCCVIDIPTIETVGGGSARCMIAENFLPTK